MNAFYRLNLPIATPFLSPSNTWLSLIYKAYFSRNFDPVSYI